METSSNFWVHRELRYAQCTLPDTRAVISVSTMSETGTLISGDNVVGLGSVLIDPPEGNMRDYLESLGRMRALPNLSVIFGGHGPAIANPYTKLDEYISHRLEREQKILEAVRDGAKTAEDIVVRAYTDVSPKAHAMAERAVLAHLEKLEDRRSCSL